MEALVLGLEGEGVLRFCRLDGTVGWEVNILRLFTRMASWKVW